MTYAISSALNRYDNGTATSASLRAAWIVASTSSEFGPHHTSRSPLRAPAARNPLARRFTMSLSSANVVELAVPPPLLSTITATRSGWVCACTASTSGASAPRSIVAAFGASFGVAVINVPLDDRSRGRPLPTLTV